SLACLQAATKLPLVCGFSAILFHSERQVFTPASNEERAISGTLDETHASYLAMKSSHSGTPILSPVDAVVPLVGGAGVEAAALFELSEAVLVVVSVLLHPTKIAAQSRQPINTRFLYIGNLLLQGSAGKRLNIRLRD